MTYDTTRTQLLIIIVHLSELTYVSLTNIDIGRHKSERDMWTKLDEA